MDFSVEWRGVGLWRLPIRLIVGRWNDFRDCGGGGLGIKRATFLQRKCVIHWLCGPSMLKRCAEELLRSDDPLITIIDENKTEKTEEKRKREVRSGGGGGGGGGGEMDG